MNFNFEPIEKGRFGGGGAPYPDDVLRLNKDNISISANIANNFNGKVRHNDGRVTVKIGVAYDHRNQAIKVFSDENGFVADVTSTGVAQFRLPRALKKENPFRGDYLLVEGTPNVFKLA